MTSWSRFLALTAAAAVLVLAGCGDEPSAEAPKLPGWQVIEMPDGWPQIVTFCDHGNRLYVGYSTSVPIGVAAADTSCGR
jgi:hypothetical protein